MTLYPILISSDAESDLIEAVDWYRAIDPGLEKEFLRAVDAGLSSIRRNPEQYALIYKNVRRALLRKFPYAIFYFVFDDTVVVIACFHTRRDPKGWQDRV
ncbi:MAG TPA: type II toxin-antitoxin system RelE/ParE family toxin [Blastocatellia bacterium]|jgi:plasmid stabilization system protein ParE